MARAGKLKVYRTAAGFHDAYVAAPSQKAALAAWGSDHDLFARGIAELVTDPDLSAEPLASPGVVIKRSRGTTAEQIAALPARAPATSRKVDAPDEGEGGPRRSRAKAAPTPTPAAAPKPKPKPKPSRRALEAAEEAFEACESEFRRTLRTLADREAALARERRELERSRDKAVEKARAAVEAEKQRYDDALAEWKG